MTWTPTNAQGNLRKFRGFVALQSLDFTRGIFVLFLFAQGMTNAQVGALQSILFWTIFCAEIPTRVFADHFRRKASVAIGLVLLAATFGLFPSVTSFMGYAALFVLWGLSSAFSSGAASALLYDGLKSAGPRWLARHLGELGRLKALSVLCMAASMGVAGFVYSRSPALCFLVTAATTLLAFLVLCRIDEAKGVTDGARRHWKDVPQSLLAFSRSAHGRSMLLLMFGLSLLEACHTPLFIFSQSLLKESGADPATISGLLALSFLVSAGGMYVAPRLGWKSLRWPVIGVIAAMAAIVVCIRFTDSLGAMAAALVLANLLPNCLFVFTDHYIQENAGSDIRASWGSTQSFVTSLAISISYMGMGYAGDLHGMKAAMLLFLFPLALSAVVVFAHTWRPIRHAALEADKLTP